VGLRRAGRWPDADGGGNPAACGEPWRIALGEASPRLVEGRMAKGGMFCFAMLYGVERLPLARSTAIALAAVTGSWLLFERLLSVPLPKPMMW
jgi:hypothetical protein